MNDRWTTVSSVGRVAAKGEESPESPDTIEGVIKVAICGPSVLPVRSRAIAAAEVPSMSAPGRGVSGTIPLTVLDGSDLYTIADVLLSAANCKLMGRGLVIKLRAPVGATAVATPISWSTGRRGVIPGTPSSYEATLSEDRKDLADIGKPGRGRD